VFAMTRSLAEATAVAQRRDPELTWGIGTHPGVAEARSAYDPDRFRALLPRFTLVGEVGLDRRAGREDQRRVFTDILTACQGRPVLISVHSAGRTAEVVDLVERHQHPGAILHWFLGSDDQLARALNAGAYLSVNDAMSDALIRAIPTDRLLPETDYPARQTGAKLPGAVSLLEQRLSHLWGLPEPEVRHRLWANLKAIAISSGALDGFADELADRLLSV